MKTNATTNEENRAKDQAAAQYSSICEMVANLDRETAIAHFASQLSEDERAQAIKQFAEENEEDYILDADTEAQLIRIMEDYNFEPEGFTFDEDEARQTIQEDALSVEVRSGWQSAGETLTPSEFAILLCTGGPAVRIRGELNQYNEPARAWLEYQDWGTPWMQYCDADQDTLLAYAREFYFGE